MNKFNYLQIVGTTILISPLIVLGGAASAYELTQTTEEYTSDEVVEVVVETKKDSVVVVKEVPTPPKPVVPTPPQPKPVVKDTLPKVVVKSDSVEVEVEETKTEKDTTQTINY
jgi:hypothetical protein